MTFETVERYLYAATKDLPKKSRADIERELRADIADMLDARCQGRAVEESDIRAVLEGFGPPEALARQYGARGGSLIGPTWYRAYKTALGIALGATAAYALSATLSSIGIHYALYITLHSPFYPPPSLPWGQYLFTALTYLVYAFALVTVVFVLIDKITAPRTPRKRQDWVAALLPVPSEGARIGRGRSIVQLVGTGVLFPAVAVLSTYLPILLFDSHTPETYPFYPGADTRLFSGIALLLLLGAVRESNLLAQGRYCLRAMVPTALLNGLGLFVAGRCFLRGPYLRADFVQTHLPALPAPWPGVLLSLNYILFAAAALALVLDTAQIVCRTIRYGRGKAAERRQPPQENTSLSRRAGEVGKENE